MARTMCMVEKAARDLCEMCDSDADDWVDAEAVARIVPDIFLEQLPANAKRYRFWVTAVPFVTSVLRSLEHPTDDMTQAGLSSVRHGVSLVYRPMIQAALEGK